MQHVCTYAIDDASKRNTKEGKALILAFQNGPSLCIKGGGSVKVNHSKKLNKPQEGEASSNGNESYNYSILGAFYRLKSICEADSEDSSADKQDNANTPDKPNNEKPDDKQDNSQEDGKDEFIQGDEYKVTVELPGNGKTVWTLVTNANMKTDIKEVIGELQKGDQKCFRKAYAKAAEGLTNVPGIVPIKVETYIEEKDDNGKCIPFFGHCRFAIDSGSVNNRYSRNDSLSSATLTVAVAPLNAINGNKPNEDLIFHADYNVTNPDAILGDKLYQIKNTVKDLKDLKNGTPSNSDSEQDISEELSKYLNSKFQTPGDSSMYGAYKDIVKQINVWVSNNVISKAEDSNAKDELKKIESFCKGKDIIIYF